MGILKRSFLILALPLVAFTAAHKFYISVTNVTYSEKDRALQITTRIFIDDFDELLKERYGITAQLGTEHEFDRANEYIEKYVRAKFLVRINGSDVQYRFLGKKYDNDVLICYLEAPKVDFPGIKSIEIQNELLMDIFEDQQNIVHFKLNDHKKSFILIRENNKGVLNL